MLISGYVRDKNNNLITGVKIRVYKRDTGELIGEGITGDGVTPFTEGDPYYDNVVLLLPMQGANNGTVFTDYSKYNYSVTRNGNVVTSTAQFKYGNSSAYFNGSSYLFLADNWRFDYGNTQPTIIEYFIYKNNSNACRALMFGNNGDLNSMQQYFNTDGSLWIGEPTNNYYISGVYVPPNNVLPNNWYHIAMVFESRTIYKIYINGSLKAQASPGKAWGSTYRDLKIGVDNTASQTGYLDGYIQNLRITKGHCRYKSDFVLKPKIFSSTMNGLFPRTLYSHGGDLGTYKIDIRDHTGVVDLVFHSLNNDKIDYTHREILV